MTLEISSSSHNLNSGHHLQNCSDCKKLREEIDARGSHFTPEQMAKIAATWAFLGNPIGHDREGATFRLSHGETVQVSHHQIGVPNERTHEWFRGVALHAREQWGGGFEIAASPHNDTEYRLKLRAYASAYGVQFTDHTDQQNPLSQQDLAKLPGMIAEIRKLDPTVPPPLPSGAVGIATHAQTSTDPATQVLLDHIKKTDATGASSDDSRGLELTRENTYIPPETYFDKTERERKAAEPEERRERDRKNQLDSENSLTQAATSSRQRMRIEDRIAESNASQQSDGPKRERTDWGRYFKDEDYRRQVQSTLHKEPDRPNRERGRDLGGLER